MRAMIALALSIAVAFAAQGPSPTAKPEDVKSVDSILKAVYDVISGPPGKKHDWDRFRSLFVAEGRLIVVSARGGLGRFRSVTPEEYVTLGGPTIEKEGFAEREIARKTEQFGNIAQVFSTYESRHLASDPKPFERGINGFQLFNDGSRWWIISIFWQGEDPKNPIPKKYLPG